jgi:excisionase family DNA binding protein
MARTNPPAARLIDINELADRFGVRVRYIRRLVAERRIPYIKLGHLVRFDPAEVEAWIDRARVQESEQQRWRNL